MINGWEGEGCLQKRYLFFLVMESLPVCLPISSRAILCPLPVLCILISGACSTPSLPFSRALLEAWSWTIECADVGHFGFCPLILSSLIRKKLLPWEGSGLGPQCQTHWHILWVVGVFPGSWPFLLGVLHTSVSVDYIFKKLSFWFCTNGWILERTVHRAWGPAGRVPRGAFPPRRWPALPRKLSLIAPCPGPSRHCKDKTRAGLSSPPEGNFLIFTVVPLLSSLESAFKVAPEAAWASTLFHRPRLQGRYSLSLSRLSLKCLCSSRHSPVLDACPHGLLALTRQGPLQSDSTFLVVSGLTRAL